MPPRARSYALILILFHLVCGAASAQEPGKEQELLRSQAGRYPMRAYLAQPAAVGPARIVVELGPPTVTSSTPRTRAIRVGSPPDSPYAEPTAPATSPPQASAFENVEVTVALDMPDMPTTKSVSVTLKSTAPGLYEGDALLTMKGTWRFLFLVSTPDGVTRKPVTVTVGSQSKDSKAASKRDGLELCSPEGEDNVPVTVHCVPDPPRVGTNLLRIEVPDAATVPVMVGVEMQGMMFGIPPTEAVQQDDGSYQASITLPMAGYWQLRVDLNGQALPPFALNVDEKASAGLSRILLPWVLIGALTLVGWCAFKRRDRLVLATLCGSPLILALAAGAWLETRERADHPAGMTMEMMAADMGLGRLTAPLPVLETNVEISPFVVSRTFPATVQPANETLVLSPASGLLSEAATAGTAVKKADLLARVGGSDIKAKRSGVVVRSLLASGASVSPGEPLLILTDTRQVTVRARAPVADRAAIKVGMAVQVADSDGQATPGKVIRVAATSQAGSFEFEAVVEGRKQQGALTDHDGNVVAPAGERDVFFIGQNVALQVVLETLPVSASVPQTAVRQSAEGARSVFVIERVAGQRVARSQQVTLGVTSGSKVQILSGLQAGQTVVARAESSLKDGDVVVPATLGEGVFRSLYVPDSTSH